MDGLKTVISLCFIFITACESGSERKVIFTKNAPAPIGPYSQAILVDGTLYVAGQIGLTPDGRLDSSSIENECLQALKNIKAIVEAAGLKLEDVTKSTVYLTDISNFSKMNAVYAPFFNSAPQVRETVGIKSLPKGAHIEIAVIAVTEEEL